jgi:hypothetical protein
VTEVTKASLFSFTTTALVFSSTGPSFCWQGTYNALWYDPDGAAGALAADLVVSASGLTPNLGTFFFADNTGHLFDQTYVV